MQALRITLDDGQYCDLSDGLDAGQALEVLSAVRSLFTGPESQSEGWTIHETPDGFVAQRGHRSARFTLADMRQERGATAVEMVGKRRKAAREVLPAPRNAAAVAHAVADILAGAFEEASKRRSPTR